MLKIVKNPNEEIFKSVMAAIKANSGYCPCRVEKTASTKCPCQEFREQATEGECHCGAYTKVEAK